MKFDVNDYNRGILTDTATLFVRETANIQDLTAILKFIDALSEVNNMDMRDDYHTCEDNDWIDLIDKYWNILSTCDGEIRLNALRELQGEIHLRLSKLPPNEDEIKAHNPSMGEG